MSNKYLGHENGLIGPVPENVIESKPDFRDYDQGGQYHNAYVTWFNKHLSSLTPIPCEGWVPEPGREHVKGVDFKILRKADKVRLENDKEVITPGERFAVPISHGNEVTKPVLKKDYKAGEEVFKEGTPVHFSAGYYWLPGGYTVPSDLVNESTEGAAPVLPAGGEGGLTVEDYKEVIEDHKRIAREMDIVLNGSNAASQPSLVDILAQLRKSPTYPAYSKLNEWSEMQRLYEWLMDESRKPAETFFTSGELRNVAKEIEYRLSNTYPAEFVEWVGVSFQRFHYMWIKLGEDPYTTKETFYTLTELYNHWKNIQSKEK